MASFADAPAGDLAVGEKIFKTVRAVVLPSLAAARGLSRSHMLLLLLTAEMCTVPHR